jgi:hypothetical protein
MHLFVKYYVQWAKFKAKHDRLHPVHRETSLVGIRLDETAKSLLALNKKKSSDMALSPAC